MIAQPEGGGRPVGSCGEGEVVHVGDDLAGVVEAVTALPAGTEDLVVPHPEEGVPDGPPRPRRAQPDRESHQAFASAVVPGTGRPRYCGTRLGSGDRPPPSWASPRALVDEEGDRNMTGREDRKPSPMSGMRAGHDDRPAESDVGWPQSTEEEGEALRDQPAEAVEEEVSVRRAIDDDTSTDPSPGRTAGTAVRSRPNSGNPRAVTRDST